MLNYIFCNLCTYITNGPKTDRYRILFPSSSFTTILLFDAV